MLSIPFEGRQFENQTLEAVEVLYDFMCHDPLKEQLMVQNTMDKILIK